MIPLERHKVQSKSACSIEIRLMRWNDIPAGMQLVDAAGWNQTEADWERFLTMNPEGCFVAEWEGRVVGTVASVVYESRLAWIGMVLVSPECRGWGIATQLLERVLKHLESLQIPAIKLDATPQGIRLYERLGFRPELEIERWVLEHPVGEQRVHSESFISENQWKRILNLDRDVFGADRGALLRSFHASAPAFTAAVGAGENLEGYTLGRHGRHADHLGPWIAKDEKTASWLLKNFIVHSTRGRIIVDCVKSNPNAHAQLCALGFEIVRPLTRMARGSDGGMGRPEFLLAILGPEFG